MSELTRYIVIDDDEFNNKICTVTLGKISPSADVKTFMNPSEGLAYIKSEYAKPDAANAVVFLDINMPVMNGWEFLEQFETFDEATKAKIKIYILSSSVDKRDMERAKGNKNVVHYLIKPLTKETIKLINHAQSRVHK